MLAKKSRASCRVVNTYSGSYVSKYVAPGCGTWSAGTHVGSTSLRTGTPLSSGPYTDIPALLAIQFANTRAALGCGALFHKLSRPKPPATVVGISGRFISFNGIPAE